MLIDERAHTAPSARDRRGFTLVEVMITLTAFALVVVILMTVMYAAQRSKTATSNRIESAQAARVAMDMIARDLRCAGFGADLDWTAQPQPPIAYVDSVQVLINANLTPYPAPKAPSGPIPPLAYQPTGNPRPFPLNGTAWEPPIRYRTGAEVTRYTLDANNDGQVDSDDLADPAGLDAQRTPNPNDYVLLREVYGDSVGNVANNNGGQTEAIALVRAPGGAVPPMFRVYMRGSATPWDWGNGPVPAAQLQDIERIELNVVAASGRPDSKGAYSETRLTSSVNSLRNVPDFGAPEYAIDGYVFEDLGTPNGVKDAGEPGLPNVSMRLGTGITTSTSATGYFIFRVPAGTYSLKHKPPPGYGVWTSPDSFVVTVGPAVSRSFADTARAGGTVTAYTYEDEDGDGFQDAGELAMANVTMTLAPGPDVQSTNTSGYSTHFSPVGNYTVTATPPDSFIATTTNPVSGTMVDGGSASYSFGLKQSAMSTFQGKVFTDNNRNGTLDGGEAGIQGVWVGVTPDAGLTVMGYQYTDVNGDFDIDVPSNNPPGTNPYYVMTVVKQGYFPTSSTSMGPYVVSGGQTTSNVNFGEVGYQIITLNASRVLSLASRDVIEKDWNGNQTQNARGDADILLGADASGADQISVWFNQYNGSPIFDANASYPRTAQQSVLSLAVDTLDNTASWKQRPDVVTGTTNATGGNFFVWLTQNSGGNEGYLPTSANLQYRTNDNGDVQATLTYDCAGGAMPDIIVGTKSPTANQGTLEVWQSNDADPPIFTRQEIYPPSGSIPGNVLGEVTAMALADFDNDGNRDLVVGTKTGNWTGQLLFFKFVNKSNGSRFVYQTGYTLNNDAVTSIVAFDISGDGKNDVIVGTQRSNTQGHLMQWDNNTLFVWDFQNGRTVNAPGIVLSLATADLGGLTRGDLVVGYRADQSTYVGGVQVFFCDANKIPNGGTDPSGGSVVNMVPALTPNNFNYGVKPSLPSPPYLQDFAAGVKITAGTGALVVFIR